MTILEKSIGTSAVPIVAPNRDANKGALELVDILIQNLSANNIYVGSSSGVTTSNGIKIATTGQYANDACGEPIFLIADVADSDVRIDVEIYKEGTRH